VSVSRSTVAPWRAATIVVRAVLIVSLLAAVSLPLGAIDRASAAGVDHLVLSEVMTGGTSASDELIELYNPSTAALPLEGLELVYVTASGATVSRRAAWDLGAPQIAPGSHLLVANELGIFAPIADAVYATGMAATGGSVALRIQGAATAIDAIGWGSAAGTWVEGTAAPAPPAGASLERLPGGPAGSTVDTNDNAADFTTRPTPDPQNSGSPPVPDPDAPSPTPTAPPTPTPVPTATPGPTGTPAPTSIPIATARALPDGSQVTIEGDALSASDFTDGGGYLADASGGIAVLLAGGSFARGDHVLVSGTLDDRFAQRTIRADADDLTVTGTGDGPTPTASATGSVGESSEGRLVRISGFIDGSPTTLTGGLAFDVDDGSGPIRVVVGSGTGIDTTGWTNGVGLTVVGVVGQRDSSGTGASGYRVLPRDGGDVDLGSAPTPSPSAGPSSPAPTPTAAPSDGGVISIADARAAAKNARVTVRGVVTLASGTVDAGSAVIQDASGAILLRLGDEAGAVSRGELLEVDGVRSTKSGMETVRTSTAPRRLGTAADPSPRVLRSGDAGESSEATLVVVRGSLVASARRASSGTVSFEIDDGSGPLRVVLGSSLAADDDAYVAGTWVEVRGVLGQETTGAQPLRGYRVWPRGADDLRILAAATDAGAAAGAEGSDGGGGTAATASLAAIGRAGLADLRVGATLVASAWPELGVAGLLWDGVRLVGIAPSSRKQVERALDGRATPLPLELGGLRELREQPRPGIVLVRLSEDAQDTAIGSAAPAPPSATMPGAEDPPLWVSVVGRVTGDRQQAIEVDGSRVAIERMCRGKDRLPVGTSNLVGVAVADPARIIVGCDGARPAPALLLTASAAGPPGPVAAPTPSDLDGRSALGRRWLAAALLAIGVAILILAAVAGRRLWPEEREAAEPGGRSIDQPASAGQQLTLVRVPDEHGR
jgi:hypothetical protein